MMKIPAATPNTEGELPFEAGINTRERGLTSWLQENHPEVKQQKHLDRGSVERAYWHYGYLVALRDVQALIQRYKSSVSIQTLLEQGDQDIAAGLGSDLEDVLAELDAT